MEHKALSDAQATSFSRIIRIAYPAILTMASFNIMQFADRMFLARYKLIHFDAVMPAGIFSFTLISTFMGIAGYVTNLVSQYYGADRRHNCARSMWQGIYFALVFGVLLFVTTPLTERVFDVVQPEEGTNVEQTDARALAGETVIDRDELVRLEKSYFTIMMATGIITLLNVASAGFFNGIGRTTVPMVATVIGNLVNIFLDWVFIFGMFGFPEMGITGAAWATFIGASVSLLIRGFVLFSRRYREEYATLSSFPFDPMLFKKLVRYGFPAGLQFFINVSSFSVLILLIGRISPTAQTAANLAFSVESVAFLPVVGLSMGISIIAGQEIGAKRQHNVLTVVKKGLVFAFIYDACIIFAFLVFPEAITHLFNSGNEEQMFLLAQRTAVPLIRLTTIWVVFDAAAIVISDVLRAAGDTLFLLVASSLLSIFAMALPGALLILHFKVTNIIVVWFTIIAFLVLLFATVLTRFLSGKWKSIDLIGEEPALAIEEAE